MHKGAMHQPFVDQMEGQVSNTTPFRVPVAEIKRPSNYESFFPAGRAGFEPAAELFPSTHLAGEPNRPLWHLPNHC